MISISTEKPPWGVPIKSVLDDDDDDDDDDNNGDDDSCFVCFCRLPLVLYRTWLTQVNERSLNFLR